MSVRPAFVQTLWADLIACTLRDGGVASCVISPGSRSTPLIAAFERARDERMELITIIDERAAAFYALGAARATGRPVALLCTSGSAAAHYLPAIVEAAHAGVPLIAITADRPPELHDCGASQTIDQRAIYGGFVRGAFELGAPVGEPLALRAVRRKLVQSITLALGPDPGPVHVDAAFRKPLEPVIAGAPDELALAEIVGELIAHKPLVAPPRLAPNPSAIASVARAIVAEPRGVIVAGAMPITFGRTRAAVFELARRAGYPIVAEAGSQLRLGPRPDDIVLVDHFDLIANLPSPALVVQLGAEPVAAGWPAFSAREPRVARWVLAGPRWNDPDSSAEGVILGEVPHAIDAIGHALAALLAATNEPITDGRASSRRKIERAAATVAWLGDWRQADRRAADALAAALDGHADSEVDVLRAALAALPVGVQLQLGNSLPIRVIDHGTGSTNTRPVITQRGVAGIDGLVASAAGATRAGPLLLVLGDVSFAHDLGGLLAARAASAPLAILVVDNGGGQIFGGLPIANATSPTALERHWLTPPDLDIPAVATALGANAVTANSPAAVASAIATALSRRGSTVTVIHAPVSATGARDVRRSALIGDIATPVAPITATARFAPPEAVPTFATAYELVAGDLDDFRDSADLATLARRHADPSLTGEPP